METEGLVERFVVDEDGEESEDVEEVDLIKCQRTSSLTETHAYLRDAE
jgi:hypothetical protein